MGRRIGFHASHELYSPSQLLTFARKAEQGGFQAIGCSDHFHPWSERHAECGFAWSWLGAAMANSKLPFGVFNAPGQRYHPAIIAQAVATLLEMYPGRFKLWVGSGEALNEKINGQPYPPKEDRNRRLKTCVEVMKRLWDGEEVTYHDDLVQVERAHLYTLPPTKPLVIGGALTRETARWLGTWADGLITVSADEQPQREKLDAFREAGGEGKPLEIQSVLSFGRTKDAALDAAHYNWRQGGLDPEQLGHLFTPRDFDKASADITREDLKAVYRHTADFNEVADWMAGEFELGFEAVYVHMIGDEMERFLDGFIEKVIPQLELEPSV